jgi:ubiquinol-cytochrome c reductase cytochrome c subunit
MERGGRIYAASCAECHGPGGEGTPKGPSLLDVGTASADWWISTGRMPIDDPFEEPTRRPSPYSPEEIRDLVLFVAALSPEGIDTPAIAPEQGRLQRGLELWAANCMACHGPGGQGNSVGAGQVASPLGPVAPVQVAQATRIGPRAMPPFGEEIISAEDLNDLIAYTEYLRTIEAPGGFALGRIGPVAEGVVAWLLGMGLLLLVIGLTGKRA